MITKKSRGGKNLIFPFCSNTMKTKKILSGVVLGALSLALLANFGEVKAAETTMQIQVNGGAVTIYSPSTFSWDAMTATANVQHQHKTNPGSASGSYFSVEDLLGDANGYEAQMTVTNLTTGAGTGNAVIPNTGIWVKVPHVANAAAGVGVNAALIDGESQNVATDFANVSAESTDTVLSGNVTWMHKTANATGLLNHYGINPDFSLDLPAYRTVGAYSGTLTLTLI